MERARCLRAVSQTAPGRLRTLPSRHYDRGARSSLVLKGFATAQAVADYRDAQPEAELRPQKPRRVPRRSAERRARPAQRMVRGNADRPWRAPHRPRVRMLSSEAPVRRLTTRLSALRLPFFIWRQSFRAVACKARAQQKSAARMLLCVVIAGRGVPAAQPVAQAAQAEELRCIKRAFIPCRAGIYFSAPTLEPLYRHSAAILCLLDYVVFRRSTGGYR